MKDENKPEASNRDAAELSTSIVSTRRSPTAAESGSSASRDASGHALDAEQDAALRAAEADRRRRLYETVLTNTPDFVYVFGLDHRVLYANDALLKMWGRGIEGAIGKTSTPTEWRNPKNLHATAEWVAAQCRRLPAPDGSCGMFPPVGSRCSRISRCASQPFRRRAPK